MFDLPLLDDQYAFQEFSRMRPCKNRSEATGIAIVSNVTPVTLTGCGIDVTTVLESRPTKND